MLRIKNLRADAFRGLFAGPTVPFGHDGVLLLGGNGVGKTSLIDAIEKVLTGRCSTVETGDQSISWNRHGGHIRSESTPTVALTLTDGNREYVAGLELAATSTPLVVTQALAAAKQQTFILRRRALLDFINARPAERYRAVQQFLNVDTYLAFERSLHNLQQQTVETLGAQERAIAGLTASIRAKLALGPGGSLSDSESRASLNRLLAAAGLSPVANEAEFETRIDDASALLATFGDVGRLADLAALEQRCNQLDDGQTLRSTANLYLNARTAALQEEAGIKGKFFADVLERGMEWISSEKLTNCPLCDSPIDIVAVTRSVTKKLEEHAVLTGLKRSERAAHDNFAAVLERWRSSLSAIRTIWPRATGAETPQLFDRCEQAIRDLNVDDHDSSDAMKAKMKIVQEMPLGDLQRELNRALGAAKDRFPDQDRYRAAFAAREALTASVASLPQLAAAISKRERLQHAVIQLDRVVEHAEAARKHAVQSLMERVADRADTFFQQIHPGESIGSPHLDVTERGTGSIALTGDFYGHRGDPRGHYSEGHLDSLGLCLFLAIRRLHAEKQPELKILILDDVLHSVDAEHRLRTAKLIFREFGDHQLVITTHDPIWFEYLKTESRGKKFVRQQIRSWTVDSGPVFSDHLSDYEWLQSAEGRAANAADRVIAAGRLLEQMLQNLCNNLEVPVVYRAKADYTIGPMWSAFRGAASKNPEFSAVVNAPMETIENLRAMRSWVGAHWNEWAQQLTGTEADEFVAGVLGLRSATYCEECGDFIYRIAQLDGVWSCEREHKRYAKRARTDSADLRVKAQPAAADPVTPPRNKVM